MNIAKSKANYLKTISRRKKRKTGNLKTLDAIPPLYHKVDVMSKSVVYTRVRETQF
jgi:hypothetical protein